MHTLKLSILLLPAVFFVKTENDAPPATGEKSRSETQQVQMRPYADQIQTVLITKEDLIGMLKSDIGRRAIKLKLKRGDDGNWVLKAWGATKNGGDAFIGGGHALYPIDGGPTVDYDPQYDKEYKKHFITRGEIRTALNLEGERRDEIIDPAKITEGIILTPCRKGKKLYFHLTKQSDGPVKCPKTLTADPGTSNPSPPGFHCDTNCDDPDFPEQQ